MATIAATIEAIAVAAPGAEAALAALINLLKNGAAGTDPTPEDIASDLAARKAALDQLKTDAT
jgi:hypothetical protein